MELIIKDKIGNSALLELPKTAFLCSRKVPASIVLECYDWAIEQRKKKNCVISGFHSKIEKDVFHYLAKGTQPIIIALHRGLKKEWEPEIQKMLDENRLLIITPFEIDVLRGSKETALLRNRLMLDVAETIKIGYASKGGNLENILPKYESKLI